MANTLSKKDGGSAGALAVKNKHIFASTSARDTYFNNNPSELTNDLTVTSAGSLQKRVGSSWVDVSAVIKGQTGVSGNDGKDAPQLAFNYSANGSTGWSATLNPTTHKYWRWSNDGGLTWSADGVRFNSEGTGVSDQQASDIAANTSARHDHANKLILDNTTGVFTLARQAKLDGVQDTWKGSFANATELNTTYPAPTNNWSALNRATGTVWSVVVGSWIDTGASSAGDMIAAVYDPQGVASDMFNRANHIGNQAISTITGLGAELIKISTMQGEIEVLDNQINSATTGLVKAITDIDTQINETGMGVVSRVTALEALSGTSGRPSIGDSKFSYKTTDHDGWYILNGRNASTLSVTAQAAATTLGWTTTIPNTQGRYALAASPDYLSGTSGGTSTIARSALPNVTLSGNTASVNTDHSHGAGSLSTLAGGDHSHSISFRSAGAAPGTGGSGTQPWSGGSFVFDTNQFQMNSAGSHAHSLQGNSAGMNANSTHGHSYTTPSINGGVTQTMHMPTYSSKTEFVFLGL